MLVITHEKIHFLVMQHGLSNFQLLRCVRGLHDVDGHVAIQVDQLDLARESTDCDSVFGMSRMQPSLLIMVKLPKKEC